MDKVHIEKNTVQETLVIPLYARMLCTEQYPNLFQDTRAAKMMEQMDYDFSELEQKGKGIVYRFGALETAMRQKQYFNMETEGFWGAWYPNGLPSKKEGG